MIKLEFNAYNYQKFPKVLLNDGDGFAITKEDYASNVRTLRKEKISPISWRNDAAYEVINKFVTFVK